MVEAGREMSPQRERPKINPNSQENIEKCIAFLFGLFLLSFLKFHFLIFFEKARHNSP